ncbi:MAG: tetraacyldisaccharide 4'-kinase [Pseudolabrys sp.]|nr:tetraacyldisaccharide 4'-kinase [Pseudolabrys sp.]
MRDPAFWWRRAGLQAALLSPIAAIYGAVAGSRMRRQGARLGVPVVCAGNFTLGGSGKTPTAIAIANILAVAGKRPALLTRGYGGSEAGPLRVDAAHHSGAQVGDEALLLARAAPTFVARDRVAGARLAQAEGCDVIVMDDGLQNSSLAKDFTVAVIGGSRGFGNGMTFPAGPLRAPLSVQWPRVDAVLIVGKPGSGLLERLRLHTKPVFQARYRPDEKALTALRPRKTLAFAGIGNPDQFFAMLAEAGVDAPVRHAFPDHYRFQAEDAGALIAQAERQGLTLVTTEKDKMRMIGEPALAALYERARALPVTLALDEEANFKALLLEKIRR